jgi:TPR repeat protein
MNKLIINLAIAMFLFTTSFLSYAVSSKNVLDIDSYNKELRNAVKLYQADDYTNALPLLEVYAKRGDKMSQYIVGTMYLNAQGTEQDLIKSYAWLTVANEQRTKAWTKPLVMLESKLSADYLEIVKSEGQRYLEQYGAKTQRLKCKRVKELGSKQPTHRCKKIEVTNGYYYIGEDKQYNAMVD